MLIFFRLCLAWDNFCNGVPLEISIWCVYFRCNAKKPLRMTAFKTILITKLWVILKFRVHLIKFLSDNVLFDNVFNQSVFFL